VNSNLLRWLSISLFLILIYSSFLSASYLTSAPDQITVGSGALAPIVTGLIALVSIGLALRNAKSEVRRSWQTLFVGIGMWVLADLIWGAQEIWGLTQEVYFSFADLLWIGGYLPIGLSIWYYLPGLGSLTRDLRKLVVLVVVCLLPLVVFGLQLGSLLNSPELQENGPIALLPAVYPILDAFLAGGGLLIAIYSRQQTSRWPWLFIGGALVLWAYSDILFAVATLNDLYTNTVPIRLIVDLTYTLAYLILAVGAVLSIQSDILSFSDE